MFDLFLQLLEVALRTSRPRSQGLENNQGRADLKHRRNFPFAETKFAKHTRLRHRLADLQVQLAEHRVLVRSEVSEYEEIDDPYPRSRQLH